MEEYIIKQPNGKDVNLRDLQVLYLDILKDFDAFCSQHGLKYTFAGGACIGALRHGGFIPWDDDIDVHMPRKDYERFYKLFLKYGNKEKYDICRTNKEEFHDTMLTQISLKNTTFIKINQVDQDINHGIKFEIIPLDAAPNSNFKRRIQLIRSLLFYLYNRGFAPENRGELFNRIGKFLLSLKKTPQSRYKTWKRLERKMTKYSLEKEDYLSELTVTWKYMKIRYPKEIFEGERRVKFEDGMYPVPLKAEEYLSMAFGDFMKLPPEGQRVPKHEAVLIDLDKSYKEYRGIYYLKDQG